MAKSAAAALHTEPKEPNFLQKFGHDFVHGDIFTKLSFFVWGLGYIGHGQLMKALLVTFVQGFALYFLAFFGVPNLAKFGTLGTVKMEMVFDVATMKNVVNDYDNSFEILLMSMIAFIVIAALIAAAMMVVSSNYQLQKIREAGKKTNNFVQDINVYLNEKFYVTLLTLPVLGVVVFTIVPLFILIAVAFTNYDQQHMPPNELFTWVGLNNFFTLFGGGGMTSTFSYSFAKVLTWTLVWAFFATFTNFFGGILMAMFINDKKTKFPKFWRTLFMVTIAVPQFVTLLLVRNFFSNNGIFNTMMANAGVTDFLHNIGLLDKGLSYIPFLTQPGWAMFSVQGPSLVTDFVKNVNNFNVIYLLTQGVFVTQNQALAQSNAKEIDLLVTWLFRLTQDYYNYKMAAVLGIMVFIVCAVFTIVCFHFINKKEATFS